MDNPSNPGAAAPASSPASTSASTPASSPASTPATPAATPGTGSGGAGTPIAPTDTRSNEQILIDRLKPAFSAEGEGGTPSGEIKIEEVPGDNGDVQVPDVGNENAGQEGENGGQADQNAESGETAAQLEDYAGGLGTEAMSAAIKADPAVSAALDANPELKAAFFANARRAARTDAYEAIVGSPEEAQVAMSGFSAYSNISGLMQKVSPTADAAERAQSITSVINAMVEQTALVDEDGQPLKDAAGNLQTDNSVGKFFKAWFTDRLEGLAFQARQKGDEDGLAAIDILMERAGLRAPSSANEEEMSDAMKAQKAELERQTAELNQTRQQQRAEAVAASEAVVNTQTDAALNTTVKTIMDRATGLDATQRANAEREVRSGLSKLIRGKVTYWNQREQIEARPLGAKRDAALVALNNQFANTYLPHIAREVLARYGGTVQQKQQQRQQTQAAREAAASSESRGSLPAPQAQNQGRETFAQTETALQAKLGRRPTNEELLAARMGGGFGQAAAR